MDNDTGTPAEGRTAVAGAPGPGLDKAPCRPVPSGKTGHGDRSGPAAPMALASAG